MADKPEQTKMQQFMELHPDLTKVQAVQKRQEMWERYYHTGVVKTDKSPDRWVSDKLREEGWFHK